MILRNIDHFLNKITMYRLVLYCLILLWVLGFLLSFFGVMPFTPIDLTISCIVIFFSCLLINAFFEKIFKVPSNTESTYITALILTLIAGPERGADLWFLILISALAIASKYILAINKKHIFNPAAFAMAFGAYILSYYASWWIGDLHMILPVAVTGFLITRKLQKTDMVLSFLSVFTIFSLGKNVFNPQHVLLAMQNLFTYSPILFFSLVMLTEPITSPATKKMRLTYGMLVAFLLAPFVHINSIYFSPELALLAGNIFSYLVSSKQKLLLTFKEKIAIADNTYDFVFHADKKLNYQPGQYMEWTLGHQKKDNRGMRRYFTIASSPTESNIRIGVKFYPQSSSFKKNLRSLKKGDTVVASQLAGNFTMPKSKDKKLVFLAGGIGVTPFRSMIKYLLDRGEKRNIILLYANNNYLDIAYKEIFDQALQNLGIKTIYTLHNEVGIPADFIYERGLVNRQILQEEVPDFKERIFYISGPKTMIDSFKKVLKEMGVRPSHIKTDFFPGYA